MNRLLGVSVGALMIIALAACSSGNTIFGGIQRINTETRVVTLYNGSSYTFPDGTDLSKFKVGDAVRIAYAPDPKTRKNNGTAITPYTN
jgi:hypothetical protein